MNLPHLADKKTNRLEVGVSAGLRDIQFSPVTPKERPLPGGQKKDVAIPDNVRKTI